MEAFFSILAIIAILMAAGALLGLLDRGAFRPGWLVLGGGLILVNDIALTNAYGLLPDVIGGGWNWQGKVLALAITLAIAAHPRLGWERSGITLRQRRQGRPLTYLVFAVTVALFAALALLLPDEAVDRQTLAFQLTLPGLEEEAFYRGLLLLAFDRALGVRRILGAEMGWGGLLATLAFGLAHAFAIEGGAVDFSLDAFAFTAGPSLILLWLRARTGSILLPVLAHNLANCLPLMI